MCVNIQYLTMDYYYYWDYCYHLSKKLLYQTSLSSIGAPCFWHVVSWSCREHWVYRLCLSSHPHHSHTLGFLCDTIGGRSGGRWTGYAGRTALDRGWIKFRERICGHHNISGRYGAFRIVFGRLFVELLQLASISNP